MKKYKEPNTYSVKPTFDNYLENNMKKITAITLGLAIGLSAISTTSFAASKRMNADEVKAFLTGTTLVYKGKSSGKVSYTGTSFKGTDKKYGKFSGTWNVKGTKYCSTLSNRSSAKCGTWKDKGNGVYSYKGRTYVKQ